MIKTLKNISLSLGFLAALALPTLVPASAFATDLATPLCQGAQLDVSAPCADTNQADASTKINTIITAVINIISIVVGVVAVIMIIIGGLRYITSGGDSSTVTAAKNTILYAIVGLVIVALAQFIVRFVLGKVNGS